MRKALTYLLMTVLCLAPEFLSGQAKQDLVDYDEYFTPQRLRADLILAGNKESQTAYLSTLHKESSWSGSRNGLISPFNYGEYMCALYSGSKRIYSRGFNTLFQEWRTIPEARTMSRSYTTSISFPCPKDKVTLVLYERKKTDGKFHEFFRVDIDPNHKMVNCDKENDYKIASIHHSGDPVNKVDLLFIAEGYTQAEMAKFRKDCRRFASYLFDIEPYRSRKSDFNIWAVESVSAESGTDIPHEHVWRNTVLKTHFDTFEEDRYLTAPDQTKIYSLASNAQYDAIFVIVNTPIYGGGGIYNYYGLSMADHQYTPEIFVHEFGHSFAGLGDEYEGNVAYEDFYNLKVEPWEPNITSLVNFDAKWKSLMKKDTPVPTPEDKEKYKDVLGVYEGGGYMSKGMYRPSLECRMNQNTAKGFCPACQKAISDMIDFYCR